MSTLKLPEEVPASLTSADPHQQIADLQKKNEELGEEVARLKAALAIAQEMGPKQGVEEGAR